MQHMPPPLPKRAKRDGGSPKPPANRTLEVMIPRLLTKAYGTVGRIAEPEGLRFPGPPSA
jgi:hypothetical protein